MLLWLSKLQDFVNPIKSFLLRIILLKVVVTRILLSKVVLIVAFLTILLPCSAQSVSIDKSEIGLESKDGFLVLAHSFRKELPTLHSDVDASSIYKVLLIQEFNCWPKSESELLSCLIEDVSLFPTFTEEVGNTGSNNSDCSTTEEMNEIISHPMVSFTLGFGLVALLISLYMKIRDKLF
jgi:hypothetical protein